MRRFAVVLSACVLLGLIALIFARTGGVPGNVVVGSGRIEGDEVELAPKIGGRLERLFVDEGDRVEKGQLVAVMDSEEIEARKKQMERAVRAAEARLSQAREEEKLAEDEIRLQIARARKAVEFARSELMRAEAELSKWSSDYARFKALYEKRVVSKRRFEEVERAYRVALAAFEAAKSRLKMAERDLQLALARRRVVEIKKRQVELAKRELERTRYLLAEVEALYNDTRIYSPTDGVVVEKLVEEGEVISAGTAVVVVVDLNRLYLKMFVSEREIGKIAYGMPARIYVDAFPKKHFDAHVCFVAQKAEFTPKEVETFSERVHHVFAVKLCPKENKKGFLKPGMPATGVIKVGEGPWFNPLLKRKEP